MSSTTEPHLTSISGENIAPSLRTPNAQRIVTIRLGSGPRFLDAHEIPERDFNVVTRLFQNNNTQRWVLTDLGGGLCTIMQVSSGRYLDAHEIESLDFRVVTRTRQDNDTQRWLLNPLVGDFFSIQQWSNGRVLRAHETAEMDFQVVTQPELIGGRHLWEIVDANLSPRLVDRSAEFGTPPAAGPPTACVIPGLGVHNIAYRDTSGRLHELWRDAQRATGTTNLTANAGAPPAVGNPFAYVDTSRNTEILLFRGGDEPSAASIGRRAPWATTISAARRGRPRLPATRSATTRPAPIPIT